MQAAAVLDVKTFGVFSISRRTDSETIVISEQDGFSRKLWGLIEYLVVFRKYGVKRSELIDAFWGEEHGGNPANNLKALIFRARNAISVLGLPSGKEIILCENSSYRFNESLAFNVDTERFDSLCFAAESADKYNTKLENSLAALRLYEGDFLSRSTDFSWAATLNTYYRSKYLKLCNFTIGLLKESERHDEIISICKKALILEPFEDALHRSLIEALIASGAVQAAMQHYIYAVDMYISKLEVSPSKELTALYHKITSSVKSAAQDLNTVRNALEENEDEQTVFTCEYAAFKDIYRLEARNAARTGKPCQLVMLALTGQKNRQMSEGQIHDGMEYLRQAIQLELRLNDIFTKFSSVQYLILLPSADRENGEKVIERISQNFCHKHPKVGYMIKSMLLPVIPYRRVESRSFTSLDKM